MNTLYIYTVYNKPKDYPEIPYVVRRFAIEPGGNVTAEKDIYHINTELDSVRTFLTRLGLINLGRQPDDEPHIVESWV